MPNSSITRIEEIRDRLAAATPGPWRADDEHGDIPSNTINRSWCVSATKEGGKWSHDLAYLSTDYGDAVGTQEIADAQLMAHAPSDLEYLLGIIDHPKTLHNLRAWLLNHLLPRWLRAMLTADGSNVVADQFEEEK